MKRQGGSDQQRGANHPHQYKKASRHATDRSSGNLRGRFPMLTHHRFRKKTYHQHDPRWRKDQIIRQADDRDNVGDQINR